MLTARSGWSPCRPPCTSTAPSHAPLSLVDLAAGRSDEESRARQRRNTAQGNRQVLVRDLVGQPRRWRIPDSAVRRRCRGDVTPPPGRSRPARSSYRSAPHRRSWRASPPAVHGPGGPASAAVRGWRSRRRVPSGHAPPRPPPSCPAAPRPSRTHRLIRSDCAAHNAGAGRHRVVGPGLREGLSCGDSKVVE